MGALAIEPITDTHLHVIDRTRLSYPWLGGVPPLDRDWPVADWWEEARRLGITRALHMEVDVAPGQIEAESDFVEAMMADAGCPIVGIVAACRPEDAGFAAALERARARPAVKGFRRVLHVVPDAVSQSHIFRDNLRLMGRAGLPFDVCMRGDQMPLAVALADAAPGTQLVLDHCGGAPIASGAWQPWADGIAALAERPNVAAKLSGALVNAAPGWSLADLGPWIMHVIDCFGMDRLVWGGDWPVCTLGGGLSQWAAVTRAILAQASAEERAAVWHGNADRIWALDPAPAS